MRWGVRDEATDDHQTATLCSREIDNCQRMSLGPNFIALLGDKYGFRPLCNRIKSTEYRSLRRCLIELDISTDFLDTWYKEDLNAVPPEYILQPISSILRNFTNRSEPELQSVDQRIWFAIQERLHELLIIGSNRLVQLGRMSKEEQLMKYSISVTEREVIEGCLDVNDAKSHCLVYVRSIVDLKAHLERCLTSLSASSSNQLGASSAVEQGNQQDRRDSQARRASLKIGEDVINLTTSQSQTASERKIERTRKLISRYIDLIANNNNWRLDQDAQAALSLLRDTKLETKLRTNGKNLIKFNVLWHEQDGISLKSDEHKHYLNELTEHFYVNLTKMIRRAAKDQQEFKSGLIGELLQHSHYAKHVSKTFHGRLDELDMIRAYVLSPAGSGRLPLFIYGVGGSGKTSIIARAATLSKNWILRSRNLRSEPTGDRWDEKPCIIMRFCCTTPSSSSMVGVLTSVCRQLQFNFYQFGPLSGAIYQDHLKSEHDSSPQLAYKPIPEDFVRLVFTFRQLLDNCQHSYHKKRLFIIFLDSIERLSSPAEASVEVKHSWLTSIARLPANVRLIVSCSSESHVADYTLLKGHFIRSYFKIYKRSLDLDRENSASLLNQTQKRNVDNFRLLRRLVMPAIKLIRQAEPRVSYSSEQSQSSAESKQNLLTLGAISRSSNKWSSTIRRASRAQTRDKSPNSKSLSPNSDEHGTRRNSLVSRLNEQSPDGIGHVWILHIKPMGVELAKSVAQRWLADIGRNLTQPQWFALEKCFSHCSRPIFVKLAFGEIVNWKSYSMQSDNRGLTFGSSLLDESNKAELFVRSEDENFKDALACLVSSVNDSDSELKGDTLRWHILTMEQQWINYLDYTQRKNQLTMETNLAESGNEGSVVIRVATSNSSSTGSGASSASINGSICRLANTIDDSISQLFARIELQHGYLLTKHSLSYISAARNGICENELEDILSLDDVVLDDVFQYHLPPVRRIPPLLWTRIRNDLPDYLSERDADGIVINWHHSQFETVTHHRYLAEENQRLYIHSMVADYFLGRWADRAKPFRCTKQQIQMAAEQLESSVQQSLRESQSPVSNSGRPSLTGGRLVNASVSSNLRTGASFSVRSRLRSSDQHDQRLQLMQAKADRRVPHQPLFYENNPITKQDEEEAGNDDIKQGSRKIFTDKDTSKRRYNLRKLTELPHHLIKSGRFIDLANEIIFNYRWLFAALDSMGLQALLADFEEARIGLENVLTNFDETGAIKSAILTRNQELELRGVQAPDTLSVESIQSMLYQLTVLNDAIRLSCSAIHQDTQMIAPQLIGRLLPLVARGRKDLKYLTQILDQCDKDGCSDCALLPVAHCLQAPNGLQLSSLEGHSFAIMAMVMASDRRHLLAVSNRFIMWDISTGEVSREINPKVEGAIMRQLKMGSNNEFAVAYTSDNTILVLDILTQQVVKFTQLNHMVKDEPLQGLSLVDKFGATKFVVWTKSRLLVMSVVSNELSGTISSDQRIDIEPIYQIRVDQFGSSSDQAVTEITDVQICGLASNSYDLIFAMIARELKELELVSAAMICENSSWRLTNWPRQSIIGHAIALNTTLNQVIYSEGEGNLFLRRRRSQAWSKPKLISVAGCRDNALKSDTITPIAISVESTGDKNCTENMDDSMILSEMSDFESKIDALTSEGGSEIQVKQVFEPESKVSSSKQGSPWRAHMAPIKLILSYYHEKIQLVELPGAREATYLLPRDTRNVAIEISKSQLQALTLDEHLIAAIGKRLLIYSLKQQNLLKSFDAHGARIVQLLALLPACVASASMDRTVKIWNLANLDKEVHQIDRLAGPIESISVSSVAPLAACLSRGRVGLWNWNSGKLIALVDQQELGQKVTRCKLAANGRYLALATANNICVYSVEAKVRDQTESHTALKLSFSRKLPVAGLVRRLSLFNQDSRLLSVLECRAAQGRDNLGRNASIETDEQSASSANQTSWRLTRRVLTFCHSIPDGRQVFTIDHLTPTTQVAADQHYLVNAGERASVRGDPGSAASGTMDEIITTGQQIRLPVLTRDQLHVVTLELDADEGPARLLDAPLDRRKSSILSRLPVALGIYSSRDGLLVRLINLARLEVSELQSSSASSNTAATSRKASRPALLLTDGAAPSDSKASSSRQANPTSGQVISLCSEQFSRLKAINYRDRGSVVALLDDERGGSYLVDVHSRQLAACFTSWNGKLSSDGRYGLSRMFKATATLRSKGARASTVAGTGSLGGLQLLEMRRGQPIKTLLSQATLTDLANPGRAQTSAADADIICSFTKPNDAYVYYCDSRLGRLLLVRMRDSQLIANYKLPAQISKIRCSSDGQALLLGSKDGSLSSLAIVDPQNSESLVRLQQYPSRRR